MPVANKRELARILEISVVTLDETIARYDNTFPILERGWNGRPWRFDVDAVVAFVREKQEERKREALEHDALLAQYRLPIQADGPGSPPNLTPAQQLAMAKLRKLQRDEEYELGRLTRVSEVRESLTRILIAWRELLHGRLREFAETRGIDPNLAGDLVRELISCQHELVERCRQSTEREPGLPFGAEQSLAASTEAAETADDVAFCELATARAK